MPALNVLFLAAEADPLVKVGGLGDVAGSLPRAIQQVAPLSASGGVDMRLVLPFHTQIRKSYPHAEFLFEFEVPARQGAVPAQAYRLVANEVETYLIDGAPVAASDSVYSLDAAADGQKYFFTSLAALELAKALGWQPHILHANDWHTAIAIYALKIKKKSDPFFQHTRSVLTIHNLPFMGAGTQAAFQAYGLPASRYPLLPWWARNQPLPLALQTADRIVAVSPSYAREILTPAFGYGLERLLKARHAAVTGILNGLDQDAWDPATDSRLAANYDQESLDVRQQNKLALLQEFALQDDPDIPLLILISRMDQQKGVDIALQGLVQLSRQPWQAILLGSGDAGLEEATRRLEKKFPRKVRAVIRFDASLARRMYAGADILLMPSRYEPCGLAQMIAMRYGCVPLASATGGLQDTIRDASLDTEGGIGFLFQPTTTEAFAEKLRIALREYRNQERWREIQRHGMRQDFSWGKSAAKYLELYRELTKY